MEVGLNDPGAESCKNIRLLHRRQRRFVRRRRGRNLRLPWPQRGREDHHHQNADHAVETDQRLHGARRPGSADPSERSAQALRHRFPGPQPRRRSDRMGKHGSARSALPRAPQDPPPAQRGIAETVRTVGTPQRPGEEIFRRHEAAAGDRARVSCTPRAFSFSTSPPWASIRRAATSSGPS